MKAFLFPIKVLKRYCGESRFTTNLMRDGGMQEGLGTAGLPGPSAARLVSEQGWEFPHGWAWPGAAQQRAWVINRIMSPRRASGSCFVAFSGMLLAISDCQKKLSNEQPQSIELQVQKADSDCPYALLADDVFHRKKK